MSNSDLDHMREMMKLSSEVDKTTIKAVEFDQMFDDGENITSFVDTNSISRPNQTIKRVNVDFPLSAR